MKVLDLCAGSGSATQAFRDRGQEVITLDLEGDVDIRCDIREWYPQNKKFYFVWASPVCTEFSLQKRKKCKDRNPDLSIVQACFRVIDQVKPKYWLIENPRACLRHFIGKPAYTIMYSDFGQYCQKPTDLWGTIPPFTRHTPTEKTISFNDGPRDPKKRAQVPYQLSLALCLAIEGELA